MLVVALVPISALGLDFFPALGGQFEFPDTPVDEASSIFLQVSNRQNVVWTVVFNAPGAPFEVIPLQQPVQQGAIVVFEIRFTPRQAGEFRGTLAGTARSGMQIMMLPRTQLFGRGIEEELFPQIRVEPEEINLEIIEEGGIEPQTVTIGNDGDAVLEYEVELADILWLEVEPLEGVVEPEGETDLRLSFPDEIDNGEYQTSIIIHSNDPDRPEVEVDVQLLVDIPNMGVQVIEYEEGWNMISANREFMDDFIDDEGPDMRLIYEEIIEQILLIKDGFGRFCAPEHGFWGIPAWESDEGFLVKVTEETQLEVVGELIPFDRPINLRAGWNIVAYYPDYVIDDLANALQDLIDRDLLLIAKDGYGRFTAPQYGFPGPPTFPGQGYMLKVTEDCVFQWAPEPERQDAMTHRPGTSNLVHFPDPIITDSNMSIIIRSIAGVEIVNGAELACITTEGLVAGAMSFVVEEDPQWGLAVWGDDGSSPEKDGFIEGEPLRFVYWDPVHDWELDVSLFSIEGVEAVYAHNGFLYLDLQVGIDEDEQPVPRNSGIERIYPNPFNNRTSVTYSLESSSRIFLALYDLSGQLIEVLVDAYEVAGEHSASVNGMNLAAGMYLVRYTSGEVDEIQRIVLVK